MENLQEFMLMFRMEPTFQQPTQEQINEMHQQWGSFIGGVASQARLVSTSRLGFQGKLIDSSMSVTDGITISDTQTLSGNMVIKAQDLNEAAEIAKGSPVLKAGGSVEIRTIIPMEN